MKLPRGFSLYKPPVADFQQDTINYGILNQDAALLLHMGLGKTYCALQIARFRIQFCNAKKILILAPATLLYNWKEEIDKFTEYNSIILYGDRQNRKSIIKEFIGGDYYFGIINYEALTKKYFSRNLLYNYDVVIADESAKFLKTYNTKRTEIAIDIADMSRYKMILTGTPISNKPMDIWSQYRFLDGGKTFGYSFFKWRYHFFYQTGGRFKYYIFKKKLHKELNRKIYNTSIRFGKEYRKGKLPKEFFSPIILKPSAEFYNTYNDVRDEILTEIKLEGGIANIKIESVLTKLIRLQQITSGFIKVDGVEHKMKYTPKLDALEEYVDESIASNEAIIIWCWFKFSIKMISEVMKKKKIKFISMSGGNSNKEKTESWKKFQKSKTINVFIGQIVAGGIGINLYKTNYDSNKAQHMIFYENTQTLQDRLQALGRIDRVGVIANTIYYKDLIVKDSVDEKIIASINKNKDLADLIVEGGNRDI